MSPEIATVGKGQDAPRTLWRMPRFTISFLACLFCIVEALSFLIPPLQSPDEIDHLNRAYLLSKGTIFLSSMEGATGGNVDTGLLAYMDSFQVIPFHYERKIARSDIQYAHTLTWTDRYQFRFLPNTALYFPIPYVPQAAAFALGNLFKLRVDSTYYLARCMSLVTALFLLWVASTLYPLTPLVAALFVTPMTLFQLGSASLDAVTYGMTALFGALFMRGSDLRFKFGNREHALLCFLSFSLATSRINLLPITLVTAALSVVRYSRAYLWSAAISAGCAISWIVFVTASVKGLPPRSLSTIGIAEFYFTHPAELLAVLVNTFRDRDVLSSYWATFIGVLGYLDTPLDTFVYVTFCFAFISLLVSSIPGKRNRHWSTPSAMLACTAGLSFVLIFLLELFSWSPFPTNFIDGVQGRYFTPVFILLGYSFSGNRIPDNALRFSQTVVYASMTVSIAEMTPKLLERYWTS
jgi:uncharacterized membrane protein